MAETHNLKIEVLEPTDIEAEVPRHQKLQEPARDEQNVSDGKLTVTQGDTVETYVPVITVKTEESNFGKHGLKFQRVIVTEDISVNFQHLFKKETKAGKTVVTQDASVSWDTMKELMEPVHVGEPVWPPPRIWRRRDEEHSIEVKTSSEEKKAKTRIPMSRFKPAVTKILRKRKDSGDTSEHNSKREIPDKPPRRSSIPKLNDRILAARNNANKTDANERTTVNNNNELVKVSHNVEQIAVRTNEKTDKVNQTPRLTRDSNGTNENHLEHVEIEKIEDQSAVKLNQESAVTIQVKEQLDDDFDKLYEEIVDTEVENIPDEILDAKVKDPEKLEIKFEEIVHQYDEETVELVKVEPVDKAKYSRIPLLKRRSEQEIKVPKQSDRRLSLKTGANINKLTRTKDDEKTIDGWLSIKHHDDEEVDNTESSNDGTKNNTERDSSVELINDEKNSNHLIELPNLTPAYNIMVTPDAELVKVGVEKFDITLERNIVNRSIDDAQVDNIETPEPETVKISTLDKPIHFNKKSNEINQNFEKIEIQEVGYIIEQPISINETQNPVTEYFIDTAEEIEVTNSSITNVNEDIVINNSDKELKKEENNENDTVRVATITFEAEPTKLQIQKDVAVPNTNSEFKSVQLLINTNAVEERTKSRYINKPLNKEKHNMNYKEPEEEIPMVRGKVGRILRRLTSHENTSNNLNHSIDDKSSKLDLKCDIPLKGKLNTIVNRIVSQNTDDNIKKEFDDIPTKKSVLSKIAMFERAGPVKPKKTETYCKPKRTISEEIRHSPKIVQEVLKQNVTNEKTERPYEVVTIDILKPVEIIFNNEEQVIVVENVKEESAIYENLDDLRRIETFSIENAFDSPIITDQNEKSMTKGFETYDNRPDKVLSKGSVKSIIEYEHYEPKQPKTTDQNISSPTNDVQQKDNWRIKAVLDYIPVNEKLNRLPSYEETNIKREKCTAAEEVFKQNVTNTQTKKPYEVITIEILKPVEIITNNEEQVFVVENFKEESIVYENLDSLRQAGTVSNENAFNSSIITKQNKQSMSNSLETDYNRPYKGVPKESVKSTIEYEHYEPKQPSTTAQNKSSNGIEPNDHMEIKNWGNKAVLDYIPVKDKINRLTSYVETNIRRAKSTAELDLGDAVKGKVKNMVVRMNSFDILDDTKEREAISFKERPRKRSVSEKIALFEQKLTPVKMDAIKVDTGRALNIDSKPKIDSFNDIPNDSANVTKDAEYNAKIRELTSAKLKFGSHNMSFLELRDGSKIPALALGTALLDPRLVKYVVSAAIDLGYRAIDTAFIYGNEKEVGEGIRAKIQDGTVRREDLFIMNKLWSTFHRPDLVESACRTSLRALELDYFDLFMIHNPMSFKEGGDPLPKIANVLQFSAYDYMDAWFAMEGLVAGGLVRSIGVSNFNSAQVARVLEKGRVKPVVNQVECHPYLSQQRLAAFCEARGVSLSCFGVLGSKGTPGELKAHQEAAIEDPLVQVLAAGLGISPAQLLIRFQLECGHHVVVKGSSAAHLWDNLQALGITLEPAHVDALQVLNRNKRTFTFRGMGDTHRNYPFKIPF